MPQRLIADAMLGRLARWLRALGHDVVFDPRLKDPELARTAAAQRRILLTRDLRLCAERGSPAWCVVLRERKPAQQLLELDRRLPLFRPGWADRLFTRCMVCNTPLRPPSGHAARDLLPPAVRDDPAVHAAGILRCPGCDRIYWRGSHTRRMQAWLEAAAARAAR